MFVHDVILIDCILNTLPRKRLEYCFMCNQSIYDFSVKKCSTGFFDFFVENGVSLEGLAGALEWFQ